MDNSTGTKDTAPKKYSGLFAVTIVVYMLLSVGIFTCFFLSMFLCEIWKIVVTGTAFIVFMVFFSCIILKMLSNEKKSCDPDICGFFNHK